MSIQTTLSPEQNRKPGVEIAPEVLDVSFNRKRVVHVSVLDLIRAADVVSRNSLATIGTPVIHQAVVEKPIASTSEAPLSSNQVATEVITPVVETSPNLSQDSAIAEAQRLVKQSLANQN